MKRLVIYLMLAVCGFVLYGCKGQKIVLNKVGDFNSISRRNVDYNANKYVRLTTYTGGSEKELKKSTANDMNEAIDATVKSVAGGEFLCNVKVYQVLHVPKNKKKLPYITYAVEGDVWGLPQTPQTNGK